MNSSIRLLNRKLFARAFAGVICAIFFTACGTQINTLAKTRKGFGAEGVPPSVTSLTITDSSPTNHRPFTLSWGVTVGSYTQYCFLENSTNVNACIWHSGTVPTTYLDSALDGPFVLTAYLKNSYGTSTEIDSNSVVIDHTPPVLASAAVTNVSPTNNPTFGLSFGAVTGTYSDYCINENNSAVATCAWVTGTLPASKLMVGGNGAKVLTTWLRDAAGNVSSPVDTAAVTLNIVTPTLTIVSPAAGSYANVANVSSFTVSGACGANGQNVVITGTVSTTVVCAGGAWTANLDFSAAGQGPLSVIVNHSDGAGNAAIQVSRSFTKDTLIPTVAITSPAAGSIVNNANKTAFVVSGTCSENGRVVTISGAGSATPTCTAGAWTATLDVSAAGDGTITVFADHTDVAGNNAVQASRTFTKDTTNPTVAITSPVAGTYANNSNKTAFIVSGTCSENGRIVTVSGAGSATPTCTAGAWTATLDVSGAGDGAITIFADHSDAAGNNAAQASRIFNKDTVNPTVAITAPSAGTLISAAAMTSFAVSGTCSENGRTVALSGSATGSALCGAGTWSTTLDFTAAADGTVTVHADLSDVAGNGATQDTRTFVKDATVPTVTFSTPLAGSYVNNANKTAFAVTGTCSENGRTVTISGAASATPTCTAGAWSATLDVSAAGDGAITLFADHSDAAGNNAVQASRSFTKDTVNPTVTIVTPVAGTVINAATMGSFTVSGACSENTRTVTISGTVSATVSCAAGAWSANLDFSAVADGPVTVHADHTDAAGNNATQATINYTKTANLPTVAITSPAAGSYVNNANKTAFVVSGTCSENGRIVTVSGAGSATPTCSSNTWTATLDVSAAGDGAITIYADHTDASSNNAVQASRTFNKDTANPTVTITSPAANSYATAATYTAWTVSGACSENTRTVSVSAGGGAVTATPTCTAGAWSATLNLTAIADGAFTVTADLSDAAGNTATQASRSFNKDIGVPTVTITSPAANSYAIASTYTAWTVSGACSENTRTVSVSAGGGAVTASPTCTAGAWSATLNLTAIADGAFTVTADHTDAGGNPAVQASRTFNKDIVLPTVAITSPAAMTAMNTVNFATFPVSGTCSENGQTVTFTGATGSATCSGGTWSTTVDFTAASDGTVALTANLSDVAGNPATPSSRNFVKDTGIPTLTISTPAALTYANIANVSSFTVTGTCSENGQNVVITGNASATVACASNAWTANLNFTAASDGGISITANHSDAAGNGANPQTRNFNKDVVAPTVTLTSPAANSYATAANYTAFTVSGACSENTRTVSVSAGGGAVTASPTCTAGAWTTTLNLTAIADGAFTVTADHTDVAGNPATQASVNYTKDIGLPTVTITSPAANSYATAATYTAWTVSGACSENGRTVSVSAGGGAVTATPTCTALAWSATLNLTAIADGAFTVTADHTDAAGNSATQASRSFNKDIGVPTVTVNSPAANSYATAGTYTAWTVGGACSENGRTVSVSAGGGAVTATPTCTALAWSATLNLTAIADGAFTVTADHSDAAGNNATQASRSFNKDIGVPTVTIALPTAGSYVNAANKTAFAISGACSENGRTVTISGAGATTATCTTGAWSANVDVSATSDGSITLYADLSDAAGNNAVQASKTYNKDTIIPTVTLTSPAGGTYLTSTTPTFSGACSETGQTVSVSNGINTATPTCTAGHTWSTSALDISGTADGPITITANHSDVAGNPATQASVSYTKDTTIPTVAITSPAANSYTNQANASSFAVSGTCSEATRTVSVSAASGAITASPTCTAGHTWSTTLNASQELDLGNAPLTSNLVFLSHMNGSGAIGNAATITSAIGPNGTTVGANMAYATAKLSSGVQMDGAVHSNLIDYSTSAALTSGFSQISISTWVYNTAIGTAATLLSQTNSYRINVNTSGNIIFQTSQNGTSYGISVIGPVLTANTWYHIVETFDGTTARLYVNGAASTTGSGTAGPIVSSGRKFIIGGYDNGAGTYAAYWPGIVDEVAIWNTTLSAAQVTALYNSQAGTYFTEGTFAVTADHSDAAGNNATQATINYIKDTVAPLVAITSPAVNAYVTNATKAAFPISGTCSDNGQTVTISGAGSTTTACAAGAWSTTVDVSGAADGTITLNVAQTDVAGNSSGTASSRNFVKDATLPTVAITSPAAASYINNAGKAAWVVSGTCSENGQNVVLGGSASATVSCTAGAWTKTFNMTAVGDGPITITADHSDAAGNAATQDSRAFTKDVVAPTLAITAPAALSYVNNANKTAFTVSGTCSDNGQTITLSGAGSGTVACASNVWSKALDVSAAADGTITINADYSDLAGNPATTNSRNFTKDVGIPTLSFSTPSAGAYANNATKAAFAVTGACSESGATITFSGAATGTTTCTGGLTFSASVDVSAQADGAITLKADMSDAAGNPATQASRNFNKDIVPPAVTVTAPNGGESLAGGAAYGITFTATDTGGSGVAASIALDYSTNSGSTYPNSIASGQPNSGYSWTVPSITSTTARVRVTATDNAGNTATDGSNADFSIDSTAPNNATGLGWSSSNPHNTTSITATWTKSTSGDLATQSIQFYTNSGCTTTSGSANAVSPPATGQSYAWTAPADGTYWYKLTSADAAGNSATTACVGTGMVVDTTPPTAATPVGWAATSPLISLSMPAAWTKSVSTDLSDQTLQFYSDATCTTTSGSSIDLSSAATQTYSWTAPSAGTYSYKITSVDSTGWTTASACSGGLTIQLPTYSDNFDDNFISSEWADCTVSGLSIAANCSASITKSETGQQATLTIPSGLTGQKDGGYTLTSKFDLTGAYVQVQMPTPPITGASTHGAGLWLEFGGGAQYIYLNKANTQLYGESTEVAPSPIAFSATNHKWLRVGHRTSGDQMYMATSPDGLIWTDFTTWTRAGGLDLSTARLGIIMHEDASQATARTAAFDNFATSARFVKPATFVDTFPSTTIQNQWGDCTATAGNMLAVCTAGGRAIMTRSQSSGQAVITIGTGGTGNWEHNGFATTAMYDYRDAYIQVDMQQAAPSPGGHSGSGLLVDFGVGVCNGLLFYKFGTLVSTEWATGCNYGGNADFTYNSTNHRWLRIRHSVAANKVYFETSPDGSVWTTQSSMTPDVSWNLQQAQFSLVGEIDGIGESSITTAKFDNFSTNAIKLDNFDDNSLAGWWTKGSTGSLLGEFTAGTMGITEAGNGVTLTYANATGYDGFQTKTTYDMTDSYVQINTITKVPDSATGCNPEGGLWVQLGGSHNTVELFKQDTHLYWGKQVAGVWSTIGNVTYSAVNHKYLRIRHSSSANLIYFDTSADNVTWTNRASIAPFASVTTVTPFIYGGWGGGAGCAAGTSAAKFDDFTTNAYEHN